MRNSLAVLVVILGVFGVAAPSSAVTIWIGNVNAAVLDDDVDVLGDSILQPGAGVHALAVDVRIRFAGPFDLYVQNGEFVEAPGRTILLEVDDGSRVHIHGTGFNYPVGQIADSEGTLTGQIEGGGGLSLRFRITNGSITLYGPSLSLTKAVDPDRYSFVGDVLEYTLVATNAGDEDLTGAAIVDPMLDPLDCTPAQPAALAPGETLTCTGSYVVTQAELDAGSVVNQASASAQDPDSQAVNSEPTSITAELLAVVPALSANGVMVLAVILALVTCRRCR